MRKVFLFLKPYRIAAIIALSLTLLELLVELFLPMLMAKIIDEGILVGDLSVVFTWGSFMLGMTFIVFCAGVTNSFFSSHVSQSVAFDIRKALYSKIQTFTFANFNRFPTASLITRLTNDVTQLQNTVFMSLRIALRAPLLVFGGMIMSLFVNARLAFFLVVTVPLLITFLLWVMNKGGKWFKTVQERLDGVNSVMRENLAGMRLIKAFLRQMHEMKRFSKANTSLKDTTMKALRLMEIVMPVLMLIMNLSIILILWFGSFEVNTGGASVGEVVAIINYAMRMTAAFSVFSWIIVALSRAKASAQRVEDVLQTDVDVVNKESMDKGLEIKRGKLEFQSVSFTYPDGETPVLKNVSFTAEPGDTVAILGATGAGKTTLFNLIPRLYDVNQGQIIIDDHDIKEYKLEHLRQAIGYVSQEVILFSGSVRENIAWGKELASSEEIREAALHAQIHETIMKLPKQYDTLIGQRGVNLSGGQKQRLSIARALIRKPKILLLDDSTSALDVKTEAKLLQALKMYRCTTLIITQKISTAMDADLILLIEDGEILEQGSHQELIKKADLYQRIFQSQFGKEAFEHAQRHP